MTFDELKDFLLECPVIIDRIKLPKEDFDAVLIDALGRAKRQQGIADLVRADCHSFEVPSVYKGHSTLIIRGE